MKKLLHTDSDFLIFVHLVLLLDTILLLLSMQYIIIDGDIGADKIDGSALH